ncbi:3-methyladenine DNA glycosylase [Dulcicalothrix desertica PCC 7102]|uniref:DNA-3-methyladenine glycosylase II n=1 Tax=Dulcicalothrix desertica PCC 7102 TaxID=232991 RepID=A0A3S1CSD6_9CYAN|nr:DNA-3-methyladenine glycosylase [Dulcicalothrix desertica]RUT09660.1 3-methyladenine DNA glycosylase [Dulcicalothrix desertica PCC 7102]TWH50856.1 DNA-3-methyladenine glycosylase II [Dulcicalothrix desertica PCC 7102]
MLILQPLTEETIALGIQELVSRDNDLAEIIQTYGYPPNWIREKGFIGLIRIILGQQVSVASANAIFKKLELLVNPLTPEHFIKFDDLQLQSAGLSRQKIVYTRALAAAIASNSLDLDKLELGDEAILRAELTKIKGIGNWTVDIYLMMSLQRPDAFPASDLGVILAYQKLKDLPTRPTPQQLEVIAEKWRPWRAIATRILWHYYLNNTTKVKSI